MSDRLVILAIFYIALGSGSFCAVSGIKYGSPVLAAVGALLMVAGVWAYVESRRA